MPHLTWLRSGWRFRGRGTARLELRHSVRQRFLGDRGHNKDLGALTPSAINDAGQIAGTANSRAVLWQDGALTDLGTAGAGQAYGLNDAGQVVGRAKGINNSGYWQAFLWDSSSGLRFLGLAGYDTTAYRVNSSGQVTGARMLESTGSPALDEAALRKFRQWHFKPGAPPHIRIPIRFTVSGEMY